MAGNIPVARFGVLTACALAMCACEPLFQDIPDAEPIDYATEKFTTDQLYWIEYRPQPAPIPYNEYFGIELLVYQGDQTTLVDDAQLEIQATMPHDGSPHGMTTEAVIIPESAGRFEVEGMLFHMSGLWNVDVYVGEPEIVDAVRFNVECCLR